MTISSDRKHVQIMLLELQESVLLPRNLINKTCVFVVMGSEGSIGVTQTLSASSAYAT